MTHPQRDGAITIQFYGVKDSATVSGIEILASSGTAGVGAASPPTSTAGSSTSSSLAQQLQRIAQFFSGDPSYNAWSTWANNFAHDANATASLLSQSSSNATTQRALELLLGGLSARHPSATGGDWTDELLAQLQL